MEFATLISTHLDATLMQSSNKKLSIFSGIVVFHGVVSAGNFFSEKHYCFGYSSRREQLQDEIQRFLPHFQVRGGEDP